MKQFKLGQKVVVNTGGKDTIAIIDYPTIRKDIYGNNRDYKMKTGDSIAYLCRFTDNINRCYCGNTNNLFRNAQFIPLEYIFEYQPLT